MGQQQLILLVLATVIVGIAIVVGIRAFTENSIKANSDAIVQDLVRMANDAQAWKQKPAPFGGQPETGPPDTQKNDEDNFVGATFGGLGYQASALDLTGIYTNINGAYIISAAATTGLTIQGCNELKGNHAQLVVTGLTDTDITNTLAELELGTSACTAANPAA